MFDSTQLALISSGWSGFTSRLWSFENQDGDDFLTVNAVDYFLLAFDKLETGDNIRVKIEDRSYTLNVIKSGITINTTLSGGTTLVQATIPDISINQSVFAAVPNGVGGSLIRMSLVLGAAITASDEAIEFFNNGFAVAILGVPFAGSGPGVQSTGVPTPPSPQLELSNIAPGSALTITSVGLSTGPAAGYISMLFV